MSPRGACFSLPGERSSPLDDERSNSKGELRSPDKLKHVPQRAARKLSAVSFQRSAFEQREIVAACKEYGGIVIQCAARKLSAVSFQRHEIVAACKEYGGIVIRKGTYDL